jgi:tetratricopeptide (TPR) repeat protein
VEAKESIMPEKSLEVRLEVMGHRPGQFTLTFNSSKYPLTLNPGANVTFSDWLRRLHAVLIGQKDPAGQLDPQALLRNVGTWLWQAFLPVEAPTQERDALAQALRTGRTPLLLALPDTLAGLPWELLCDPQQPAEKGFLARRRPLMRFHPSNTPVSPLPLPLRVLLLISSPPGLGEDSRVDVESERTAVEQATRTAREEGKMHLLVKDIVTPQRVQDALLGFQPHVVHYIGHGGYDAATGGVLLWEDERGNALPISDGRLAEILCRRNLHAVVLHVCQMGRSNARADVPGIAGTLVNKGIPAVLAQQANFTYESSQRASKAWYTALTTGRGFAEALFEVRQALALADRPDWAVPILQGTIASLTPVVDVTALPGPPDPLLISQGAAADLRTPTGVFVGRHRELRALHLMLENAPGSGPAMALITGPGGVGKSSLAAQAVTRSGGKYKAALTLSCQGYQSVELFLQRIGEFLKRLGAPGFLEQTLPDPKLNTEAKIEEALAALNSAGPLLLVVDSLESVQHDNQALSDTSLLHLLQKLLTNLRGGRVLILGRYAVKDLLPDGIFEARLLRLELNDLSPYETSQLLMRHPTLANLSEKVREELILEFGGLPYVYDLLSRDAGSQSLDLLVHDVRGRITQARKQRSAEQWQEVRRRVVELAALEATVSRLSEPSRTLLARLGVLQRPFPLAAIEQGLGAVRANWQPLLDWSLLRYDPLEQTYRLHSITKRYAEDLLDEQHRTQTQTQLAAWYERYATRESHDLTDYLEARRLWRAAGNLKQAGELVMQLAEVLRRFGLYPLLRELCTTTLLDIRESDERLSAQALSELGNITLSQGDYQEARRLYGQSLDIFARLGDQSRRANILHQLGMIALLQGDYQEARRLYGQSLETAERLGDQSGRATTLGQLGMIAQDQGDYQEARRLYGQSLDIFARLGDQGGRATILHQLGMIAQHQGDYQEARRFYGQSLDIFARLGDQSGRATILHQLGNITFLQGDYQEARRLYGQSLETAERLGDQSGRAATLHQLGNIALLQGDYQEARRLYEQNLETAERLSDQSGRANTLHQLGMIAQHQGDYQGARWFYGQSLDIFARLGDQGGRANTLHQLGMIAQDQGDYQEARRLYEQSLDIKERLGEQSGRAASLGQLGLLAYTQGDFEHAFMYIVQAYILFDSLHSPSRDIAQRLIGRIRSHMDEGRFADLWRTFAGSRPLPIIPYEDTNQQLPQQLLQVVIDFIQAPTWGESKHFLESHLELLQPEVDAVLQAFASQQKHDDARKTIEEHRLLLAECRGKGIDGAVAEHQGAQRPEMIFAAELNRIYAEVVTTMRAGNAEQQEVLATRLEQLLKDDLPIVGALDFLRVLVAWLREQGTQTLEKELRPPFRDAYAQMVAAVKQEEAENTDENEGLTVEELLDVVSSIILQGTTEERQQCAASLLEAQQQLPPEEAALGTFFACLGVALRGETPEVAALEAPFTDLWQAFQDGLRAAPGEES